MKLKALQIHGFKSFADRTRFQFDGGITGIVGPNGCGKSNVVDAIRWVLGEQKTRNLRSDKMENVLFNGTDQRKKSNMAEVAISFENTRNLLPVEYTTVTVTRRLYRDGESEYLINDTPCRLKDIHNLFLDTGIGPDSYAIIELKMVEELLNDKNDNRRQLFEEAAGISRYKIRKKETLTRLDDTDQSLARVEDILFEIEKNLKSLQKQAARAEKYLELKAEYRLASCRLSWFRLDEFNSQLKELEKLEIRLQDQHDGISARTAKYDSRIQELQREATECTQDLAREQKKVHEITEHIRELENRKEIRNERLKFLRERTGNIARQLELIASQQDGIHQRLAQLETDIDAANETYDKQEFLLNELESEHEELKQAVHNRQKQLDETTRMAKSKENTLNQQQKELDYRNIQLKGLTGELERSSTERGQRVEQLEAFTQEVQQVEQDLAVLRQQLADAREAKNRHDQTTQQTTDRLNDATEKLFQSRRVLDAKKHEHGLIKGLVDTLDGFPESVKYIRSRLSWARQAPFVSDIFLVDEAYKIAVENYLEPFLNYYVTQTREEAYEAIALLKTASKGRAQFFVLNELATVPTPTLIPPPADWAGVAVPLREIVRFAPKFSPLADQLFAQAWLYTGTESHETMSAVPLGLTLVHPSGSLIQRRASLSGGSIGLFEGKRIGRAQQLEQLGEDIRRLTEEVSQREVQVKRLKEELQHLKSQRPELAVDEAQRKLNLREKDHTTLRTKEQEYRSVINTISARAGAVEKEIDKLRQLNAESQPIIDRLQDETHELIQQLNTQQRELQSRQQELTALTNRINQDNIAFLTTKNLIENLKKDFRNQQAQLARLQTDTEALHLERQSIQKDIEALENQTLTTDDQNIQLYEQRRAQEDIVRQYEEKLARIRELVLQNEQHIREERKQYEAIQRDLNQTRDRLADYKVKKQSLTERLEVEWGLGVQDLLPEKLFPNGTAGFQVLELENEVAKLRDRYNKFGEVNPTAIETYNEIKERYDFIATQKADLLEAKTNLLTTIAEIDTTAREQFMQAFEQIRENFVRVFRTLFTEQDDCDLKLLRPDDPLESPIDILARPKGKRPLTINQLSGGEKTLTAISLLFAIYLLKPAPFCIFDEVDAPLDDANIDKFNNIMQEFSKESQFIVVTHNKRTMVKTNVMYGVTMEQTGVSRVLPVDLVTLNLAE
jgi:chromosome segregation protein